MDSCEPHSGPTYFARHSPGVGDFTPAAFLLLLRTRIITHNWFNIETNNYFIFNSY